jgi:hypothetical protein
MNKASRISLERTILTTVGGDTWQRKMNLPSSLIRVPRNIDNTKSLKNKLGVTVLVFKCDGEK